MSSRGIPLTIALAVFILVAYFSYEGIQGSAFRQAEAARDLCYARAGYAPGAFGNAPPGVVEECTRSMGEYRAGENGRYFSAGLLGLMAALIVAGALMLFLRRRSQG